MTGKAHPLPANTGRDLTGLFDLETREVSLSTMYDPQLYQIEMEKIFTRDELTI